MAFFSEWAPKEKKIVEAIHEGRIIKVYEEDAIREGLFILKKYEEKPAFAVKGKEEEKKLLFDDFRKPLRWKSNNVAAELKENFHWDIVRKRKDRGLGRKQVASAIGCSENDLKSLENGILPSNDFVLINRLEQYYKINLRKGSGFNESPRAVVEKQKEETQSSDSIEVIDLDK